MSDVTPLPLPQGMAPQPQPESAAEPQVPVQAILDNLAVKYAKQSQALAIAEETIEVLKAQFKDAAAKNARLVEMLRSVQAESEAVEVIESSAESAE